MDMRNGGFQSKHIPAVQTDVAKRHVGVRRGRSAAQLGRLPGGRGRNVSDQRGGMRSKFRQLRLRMSEKLAHLHLLQLLQRERIVPVLRRIERQRHRPARMHALDGRSLVQQGCTLWTVGLSSSKDARSGR